ncbi:SDR family oxidoreductase [Candidatus Woesearchaeota archaeon]|nr:SDR family oxidoreductase [Candidatus Woesearchaeota archaeon]MBI2130967.1 SDR family oxidoreductase [Candidatus Woesearchaeota archaeon]
MKRLEGKVAVITGSGRGIGKGIALEFAKEGCNVVISDYKGSNEGKSAVEDMKSMGVGSIFVKADVSKEKDVRNLVRQAVKKFGKLDIFVNNAGILVSGTALQLTEKDWDRQMAVNLKGVFFGTKYAVEQMKKQGRGGRIINISSIAGIVGFPGISAYCASKGGVTEFTREAALDHAKDGITVNAINPGVIVTDMTKGMLNDRPTKRNLMKNTPVGRFGQPADIGNAAVFLASDKSSFITGHNLVVDGGWTAR